MSLPVYLSLYVCIYPIGSDFICYLSVKNLSFSLSLSLSCSIDREIYFKELAHGIMEADKSKICRTRLQTENSSKK